MKATLRIFIILIFISSCINKKKEQAIPNIILIISDDQAWTDYGFMGHPYIETPNIDKLARSGITYTRGYVTAPLCSPSLATLITGLYPHQHEVTGNDPLFETGHQRYGTEWRIERKEYFDTLITRFQQKPLLTEHLSEKGFLSFQSGKWWLGSFREGGFNYGMTHGNPELGGRHGDYGLEIGRNGMDTIYNFIRLALDKNQPFFLWYAPFLPHTPHNPPDSLFEKYICKTESEAIARYWANCSWFDITVGQLLNHLESKKILKNTLLIYVCDNGWVQDPDRPNRYREGSKRSPYDMGIRTPIMVSWSGYTDPVMDTLTPVSSIDIVPTVLNVLEIKQPSEIDGINLLAREKLLKRDQVFSEVFYHDIRDMSRPEPDLKYRVIVKNEWKLILPYEKNLPDSTAKLFNILYDPYETNNLIDQYPEKVAELKAGLDDWWKPISE